MIDSATKETLEQGVYIMATNETDRSVRDILMCVIGEALMEADASFMFGHDFSPIIEKWGLLLQKRNLFKTKMYREDILEIKQLVAGVNASTPFLGTAHQLIQDKLDNLESEICD